MMTVLVTMRTANTVGGEGTVNPHSMRSAGQSGDDHDGINEYDSKKDDDDGERNNDTADIGVVTTGLVIRTAYCK